MSLQESFLCLLFVFLHRLPFATGVHIYQVDGVKEKSILHLVVQVRVCGEAGRVVHLPKQTAHRAWQLPALRLLPAASLLAPACPSACFPLIKEYPVLEGTTEIESN